MTNGEVVFEAWRLVEGEEDVKVGVLVERDHHRWSVSLTLMRDDATGLDVELDRDEARWLAAMLEAATVVNAHMNRLDSDDGAEDTR